ncbi:MAG: amidohydrolase family protein [Liquorilactobacillus nagelii]|uniref:metal-dependent hydrolase family protein n=1 Tax=Liquorilactobacillus nagelii TaxID=82688 RepID=UPI0039ECCA80
MNKLFYNFNFFDGKQNGISSQAWFEVDQHGKIVTVGQGQEYPAKTTKIDLKQRYVMPGLINAHTHIMMDPYINKLEFLSETETTVSALHNLKELLKAGVTYIRDCGCAFNTDIKLAKLATDKSYENYQILAPGIMPSGRPICITGGHADFTEGVNGTTTWGYLADSEDEMRKSVRKAFKLGAKNIKVMATGGVMSATDQIDDTELSLEEIKVAVAEAHSKHMTVAAHAEGANGIHNAVVAGVDSIEHGSYVRDKDIASMIEQGIFLIPTLIAAYTIPEYGEGKLPQYMLDKAKKFMDTYYERIGVAIKAGVKIAFGTDAGTPFNGFKDVPFELELMTKVGASNYQALVAAGKSAAELLHIDDEYGTLEAGKYADFLVLDKNPLENVQAVQQSDKEVYQHGERRF